MRRPARFLSMSLLGLFFGLLFTTGVGSGQTTVAQQPSLNLDQPVQSIEQAALTIDSDARLVDLATAWMKARADTRISYSTYRKGVRMLQQRHPEFYGNFFGDPFYATYDVDYFKMTRYRCIAARKVDPFSGLSNMFSCNPLTYDPAFNGRCRGFQFAAADFFILPSGFVPATASFMTSPSPESNAACRTAPLIADGCEPLYTQRSLGLSPHLDEGRSSRKAPLDKNHPEFDEWRPRPDTARTALAGHRQWP